MASKPRSALIGLMALAFVGCSGGTRLPKEIQQFIPAPLSTGKLKPAPQDPPAVIAIEARRIVIRDANLRSGPGTDYLLLGSIRRGESIYVDGRVKGRRWLRVSYGGTKGYVHESLVSNARPHVAATTPPLPNAPELKPDQTIGGEDELPDLDPASAAPEVGGEDEIEFPSSGPAG